MDKMPKPIYDEDGNKIGELYDKESDISGFLALLLFIPNLILQSIVHTLSKKEGRAVNILIGVIAIGSVLVLAYFEYHMKETRGTQNILEAISCVVNSSTCPR